MGKVATALNCNTPVDMGSPLQVEMSRADLGLEASIPANDSLLSLVVCTGGYKSFAFAAKGTQTGSISIQRYLDQEATIPMGAPLTGSMTANTDTIVTNVDGKPFQSMIITIANSAGSVSDLTNTALLLQAN